MSRNDQLGVELSKALQEYTLLHLSAADRKAAINAFAVNHWRDGRQSTISLDRERVGADFLDRVCSGDLRLQGRRVGADDFEWIAPRFLVGAVIYQHLGEIVSGDIKFVSVRVFATAPSVTDSTGVGGRPTSKHLWRQKLAARANANELARGVAAEAAWLSDWLLRAHPDAHQVKPKAIENDIRDEYRRLNAPETSPKTSPETK